MKFGGLSEQEVNSITTILDSEGISFQVGKDEEIEQFNDLSLHNDLRHFTPPNISTHVLAITIADEDFEKISSIGKKKLMDMGISDQAPRVEDFKPYTGESIHKELANAPKRMLAIVFKHQIFYAIILLILFFLLRKLI